MSGDSPIRMGLENGLAARIRETREARPAVPTVRDAIEATPADTAVEIVLFRDPCDGVWVAHPQGGPWPDGLDTDNLPIVSGLDPARVIAELLTRPAHPQEVR